MKRALVLAVVAACGGAAHPAPAPPPWQVVTPVGSPRPLYRYDEPIAAYAPDDRGAYVVRVRGDAEERRAAAATLAIGDDVIGDDGFVVRLTADAARALATHPAVIGLAPLQPIDRRGILVDHGVELPEVRIELYADAALAEVDAVAAWVTWRGGQVAWRGPHALRARVPREARTEASQLSVVRWIE